MTNSPHERYIEVVKEFDTAMLVTQRGNELRSRPMAIADVTADGRLWFITSLDSAKMNEITKDGAVNLSLQDGSRFLSVSGSAAIIRDSNTIDELWSASMNVWFPEGKSNPNIVVMYVVPTTAEYWDQSGVPGFKALFEIGKSILTGDEPKFDDDVHQKINFPKTQQPVGRDGER